MQRFHAARRQHQGSTQRPSEGGGPMMTMNRKSVMATAMTPLRANLRIQTRTRSCWSAAEDWIGAVANAGARAQLPPPRVGMGGKPPSTCLGCRSQRCSAVTVGRSPWAAPRVENALLISADVVVSSFEFDGRPPAQPRRRSGRMAGGVPQAFH